MVHDIGEAQVSIEKIRKPGFERLPRWAQNEILRLERSVDNWRAKANIGPENSNTFRHEYKADGGSGGQPLGTDVDIRFDLPEGDYFMAHLERGALHVRVGGRMSRAIAVRPMSNNTIRIEAQR